MTCFVGIDIGFTGGIAAIVDGAPIPFLFETPTAEYSVKRRRGGKLQEGKETELDTHKLVMIFKELQQYQPFVTIEKAQVRPAKTGDKRAQGVVSQAKFFGQFTEIRGVVIALGMPFETVHSATWKADVFRGQTQAEEEETDNAKEASRMKAVQLYPQLHSRLALKKTHGLAEALLIAHYAKGRRTAPF